jgi:PAS domain S-box-containing protein
VEVFVGASLTAEPLLALAVTVTSEQRVESVLQSIVQGLASQPGVALVRIWLLPSSDLSRLCHVESCPPDHLCLVASAGTPVNSLGEDWSFLEGRFARVPFNVGKVGQVAASRHPILIEDITAQNEWVVRPEWAKREEICSFAGHPLIFRDKLLGVIAVFSRQPLGQQEFTWLGLFANQAAVAIANACAEQALQSTERNLAAIINTIPTTAWTTRPDGYCDFLNQVWLDYAGITVAQGQGWGWAEAIHPEDRKRLVEEWQACLAAGMPIDTEARIRRFDSSYRWFMIRANPLKDESGAILKWYGTCTDIEDRKRWEQILRAREISWRQIVDNIPGLVATTGAMGEVEFLNRQTLEYFGRTNEELKDWALIDAVHPDDLPRVVEVRKKSIETGQIYEVEHRCRRADGVYRWFQVRGLPVREGNKVTAWYLLLTDIDDRRRAEEALSARELDARSLLDNMPGFLGRHSPDGTPEIVNGPFLQYLGKSVKETGKWQTSDLVHPDDLAHTIEVFGNGISGGQPWGLEFRLRRFDGIYRWFEARWVPVRDVEGRILHWNALTTDIDDRKKAEEALRSSQRDLSLMTDAIPGFIHTARADGYLDYFNQRWLEYVGCSLIDVEGWKWTSLIHPDDLQGIVEKWRECVASGDSFEYETRVRRADGQYRWMFHRKVALRDEHGNIVRWYGTSLDIEDRKRAEEALRSSERNLRLTINAIPIYIQVLRADGSVLYVNPAVLDYFGITMDEVQRDDYRTRFFHPEDVERLRDKRREALQRPVPFENEQRVLGKDGVYRWFLIRYNPLLDEQGKIDRWYAAAIDIDDRKRAEAQVEQSYLRLAEAQRLSKTGSFITDLLADQHDWSEEAFRIFEFDPKTKVSVQGIREMVHPEDLPTFDAVLAWGMTGTDVDFLFRIVTSRGAVKHIRGMARVMVQDTDRPLFIGAFQDITESKVAEAALDKARSELAHVARITSLNALTASIAHEINQPLASLITNASVCLRRLDADPPNVAGARETALRTIRDGNRASDVITRLRALFSKKEFTLEPLDLNEITREVVAVSLSDLQRNSVVLRSEFAEDLSPVFGDRVQLQQVTLNLLRNASDAMAGVDDRPRHLFIRTQREGDDFVRLSVQDAGCGVNPQDFERLFDAFYTTKSGGMGIGLSVSRSIIERHQGRLWAEQNDGPGMTFCFCVPCDPESARRAAA